MADVVTEGNGLDEIQVQMEGRADGAGDAGDQLNVEGATGDVVVFVEGKDLGLVGIAVVVGAMHDLVNVMHEGGTPYAPLVLDQVAAANHVAIRKGHGREGAVVPIRLDLLGHFRRKYLVFRHGNTSDGDF